MKSNGDSAPFEAERSLHFGNYNLLELVTPVTTSENDASQLLSPDDKESQIIERQAYQNFRTRRKYSCDRSYAIVFLVSIFAIFAMFSVALLGMKSLGPCSYNTILSFNRNDVVPYLTTRNLTAFQPTDDGNETRFQVTLFGDSLINRPFLNLDLDGKIKAYLPQFSLYISNIASSGCKISDMRSKLGDVIDAEIKPDAVILYWDSDVSDVDESKLSSEEVDDLRSKYKEDLSYILQELVLNVTNVAVAGPGILGEGPMFMPKSDRFTKDKTDMLNAYREMNKEIAAQYNCPYIDMRQAFLDAIPSYRLNYKHCVTYDGEHENEYGTLIVADLMSKTIFEWIENLEDANENDEILDEDEGETRRET